MGVNLEFETFEKDFIELISEFQSLSGSESRLRELVRTEATRAEAAEAARGAAERAASDARAAADAANCAAAHAAQALATAHDDAVNVKAKLDLLERQHNLLEEKNMELVNRVSQLDEELKQLRPMQAAHSALKRQHIELLNRVISATEDIRSEYTQLSNELRRVEKCASAGAELRERARLAAAAHARERHLAAAELQHTARELRAANAEISRLVCLVSELELQLSEWSDAKGRGKDSKEAEEEASAAAARGALQAERAGAARLERALAAALADAAALAAAVHAADARDRPTDEPPATTLTEPTRSSVCPIDSFLEDC